MLVWLAIRVLMSCSGSRELNPLSSTYFNFQLPDIRDCRQLAHSSRLKIAICVSVYDFIKASQKSNALQTRMDVGRMFTTLIACLRL